MNAIASEKDIDVEIKFQKNHKSNFEKQKQKLLLKKSIFVLKHLTEDKTKVKSLK